MPNLNISDRETLLRSLLNKHILLLDGAMGTMIQSYKLEEADYRGERFKEHPCDLKGNNDLLSITQPEIISAIHAAFLDAGADIIETNTFNSTSVAMADYQMEELAYELNYEGAKLARAVADEKSSEDKPRFVAGAIGPTNRTCSISPDVNKPGFRNISFEELAESYSDAVRGLVEGGADILLVETIFDTLNAKAAIYAIDEYFENNNTRLPIMISGTITDIEQVPKVINDVDEIVSTIATAVEEQSTTTREIASNVAQASQGIQEVTENVTQSSNVTGEIAGEVSEVNRATGEMANSSSQINMSANELSKVADKLKSMVGQFKV